VNKQNKILLGVLAVQVALVLLVQLTGRESGIGKLEPVVAGFAKDKVERVRIFDSTTKEENEAGKAEDKDKKAKPGDGPAIDLVKKGGSWTLASHFDYPVEAQKVTDLLDKIEGLRSRGPIASGAARQKQLQVADSSYQRKVIVTVGGADQTFFLGAGSGSRQTSVRLAGHDDIHGVTGLTSFGVSPQPNGWVDTQYLDVESDKIAAIDLVNANGSFHFERAATGDTWQVSVGGQPLAPPAGMEINKSEIDKVVNRGSKMYLSRPGDPKRTVDKPLATVTLHLKPEPPPPAADAGAAPAESTMEEAAPQRVIEIASADEKDRYYVREKGRAQAALVDALSVTDLAELTRDRLLKKIEEKKPGGAEPAAPGDLPMEGLPPGLAPGPDQP